MVALDTGRSSAVVASRIRSGSRPGGRPARSRQSLSKIRRRAERVADGEAEIAQRAFVGVDAQDLGCGRGALQRQAGRRPRRQADRGAEGVEQGEPGAGGEQGIALPCPSARPRPGRDQRRRRKRLPFRSFRRARRRSRALAKRRRDGLAQVVGEGRGEVRVGANHLAMVHAPRRFVTLCGAESAPLVVRWRCPISLPYRTRFGSGAQAMENTDKSGPEGSWTAPDGARGDGRQTAEASERAARGARLDATAAPAPLGVGLRSAALSESRNLWIQGSERPEHA